MRRLLRSAGVRALMICLLLSSVFAHAQFGANRAVQRAIEVNTRNALQRVQLSMQVRESAGKVVMHSNSRDGRYLLLVFADNRPRVWDLEKSRYWDQFESLASPILAGAIAGDMSFFTVHRDGRIARWEHGASTPVAITKTMLPGVVAAELARTGELIVVAEDGGLHVFATTLAPLGQATADLTVSTAPMAMDPSGEILATATSNDTLQLWSARDGTPVAKLTGLHGMTAFTFGDESRRVFIATDGKVAEWDVSRSSSVGEFPCPSACRIKRLLVNSATQSLIAVLESGELLRWTDRQDVPTPLSPPADLATVTTAASTPVLIGGTTDGLVQFSHLERAGALLTLVSTRRGWAMIDPLGRFDGQAGQDIGVSWANDDFDFPLANFVDTHFEPGLFNQWLRGGDGYLTDPEAIADGVLAPPTIALELTAVDEGARQFIDVKVTVTDNGGGVGQTNLYHLGLKVSDEKLTGRSSGVENGKAVAVTTWRVRALPGENTFTAKVKDIDGVLAPARVDSVGVAGRSVDPALHLLAIAVDDYGDARLNLNYSTADAAAVVAQLEAHAGRMFSAVHSTVISNRAATRQGVLAALRKLRDASPEDVIVIYAATHGDVIDEEFHVLLQGLRYPLSARRAKKTGIAFDEFAQELEQLDARRVVLLLDTCKSGDALEDLQSEFRDRRALQRFGNLLGVHLIAATAKGQLATESSVLGHGVFTYSIVEGLQGKADRAPADGLVTASELAGFAETGVPALSARYAAFPQWPTIYARGFDFSVAVQPAENGQHGQ